MTDYVYPGKVKSETDGDWHHLDGPALIRLHGLHPTKTVIVTSDMDRAALRFTAADRHFYPEYRHEDYGRPR